MLQHYTYPEQESPVVNEDMMACPQGVTIPVHLPTTGGYSIEFLKQEMTRFAMDILRCPKSEKNASHVSWRDIAISNKVKAMSLGPSVMSEDYRSDKELLAEALEEKYR